MSTIEGKITAILIADPRVAGLVADRIRPQEAAPPQWDILPWAVYEVDQEPRSYRTQGPVTLRFVTITYDCWGRTYAQAREVADAISSVLQPIIGSLDDQYNVQGVFRDRGPSVLPLPDHQGAPQAVQGFDMDWRIVYDDLTGA